MMTEAIETTNFIAQICTIPAISYYVVYLVIIFPLLAYCVMNMKSMSPTLVLLFLTQSIKSVSTELREIGSET